MAGDLRESFLLSAKFTKRLMKRCAGGKQQIRSVEQSTKKSAYR